MYGAIRIATDNFHLGDTVLVRIDGIAKQVARIEALWEDANGAKWFESRWYYSPDETTCGKLTGHDPREIFETVHIDENLVDCIDGPCVVLDWDSYQRWLDTPAAAEDDEDETTFVCRAMYHPGSGEFVPIKGAASLAEAVRQSSRPLVVPAGLREPSRQQGEGSSSTPSEGVGWGFEAPLAREACVTMLPSGPARKRRLGRFAEAAARLAPSATPERMPCREKERAEVIGALKASVLEGTLGGSLYLSGTPGTGKTATVHESLRALAHDRSLPPNSFRTVFVNGMKFASPYEVYTILWESLTGQAVKPARAVELLERRFATPAAPGTKGAFGRVAKPKRKGASEKVILILDELDYLVTAKQSVSCSPCTRPRMRAPEPMPLRSPAHACA